MDEQGKKTLQKMRELLEKHVVDSPDSPPASAMLARADEMLSLIDSPGDSSPEAKPAVAVARSNSPAAFRGGQVKIDDSNAPEQNPHSKMTNGALDNASKEADSQLEQLYKQIDIAQKHKKALDDERTEREKNKERGMKASLGAFGGSVQRGNSPNKIPLGFKMGRPSSPKQVRPGSPKQVRPGSPKRTTSFRHSSPVRLIRTMSGFNSRLKVDIEAPDANADTKADAKE